MVEHLHKFWKEYIIALVLIVIAGIFMSVDMVGFLRHLTGNMIGISEATIAVSYSYLFLIVIGPLIVLGMAGHTYFNHKLKHHHVNDFSKVKFSSMDHEFHHFPHDEFIDRFEKNKPDESHELYTNSSRLSGEALLAYPNKMDYLMLKQHVKNKLMQGYNMTEIVEQLSQHNWDKEKVNHAFKSIKLTGKEAEIMLGSFITRALVVGNDINSIRQSLVKEGWESRIVDKVVNQIFE
ncbi:MAG: hypothetical protein ABIG89_07600 [Candidatus Woesearchaeota archaeon]